MHRRQRDAMLLIAISIIMGIHIANPANDHGPMKDQRLDRAIAAIAHGQDIGDPIAHDQMIEKFLFCYAALIL